MTPYTTPQETKERLPYEAPAIIYEGELTTRAGSRPSGVNLDTDIDPAKLFGSVD